MTFWNKTLIRSTGRIRNLPGRQMSILFLIFLLPATVSAQTITYDFENLNLGSIQGQDGWGFAQTGDIVVENSNVSPRNGSTKAIKFEGVASLVPGKLDFPIVGGLVTISYDYFSTQRATVDNAVALLQFQDSNHRMPMGLYAQNGGAGPSPNGYFSNGINPVLGPNNLIMKPFQIPPFAYPENTWLNFIATIDIDNGGHLISAEVYDISGSSPVFLGARNNAVDGDLYFATQEGANPVLPELVYMNLFGFGMDNGTTIYMDNIEIVNQVVPEPSTLLTVGSGCCIVILASFIRRKRVSS